MLCSGITGDLREGRAVAKKNVGTYAPMSPPKRCAQGRAKQGAVHWVLKREPAREDAAGSSERAPVGGALPFKSLLYPCPVQREEGTAMPLK